MGSNWQGWRWHLERWMQGAQINCFPRGLTFFNMAVGHWVAPKTPSSVAFPKLIWWQMHSPSISKQVLWRNASGLTDLGDLVYHTNDWQRSAVTYEKFCVIPLSYRYLWFGAEMVILSSFSNWGNREICLLILVHIAPWKTCPWTPSVSLDSHAMSEVV